MLPKKKLVPAFNVCMTRFTFIVCVPDMYDGAWAQATIWLKEKNMLTRLDHKIAKIRCYFASRFLLTNWTAQNCLWRTSTRLRHKKKFRGAWLPDAAGCLKAAQVSGFRHRSVRDAPGSLKHALKPRKEATVRLCMFFFLF